MSHEKAWKLMSRDQQEALIRQDEDRPQWMRKHGQWTKDHSLESLRLAAQLAEQHEREMLWKLAEVADSYAAVKRACRAAQQRYRDAIRTKT